MGRLLMGISRSVGYEGGLSCVIGRTPSGLESFGSPSKRPAAAAEWRWGRFVMFFATLEELVISVASGSLDL